MCINQVIYIANSLSKNVYDIVGNDCVPVNAEVCGFQHFMEESRSYLQNVYLTLQSQKKMKRSWLVEYCGNKTKFKSFQHSNRLL